MPHMRYYFFIGIFLFNSFASAQSQKDFDANYALFTPKKPLKITLEMDIKGVIKDNIQKDYHQASLISYQENGDSSSYNIKVKVRGHTRSLPMLCKFPPLRLNFKKEQVKGTIFSGLDKIKLVTHCDKGKYYNKYGLREFLIYKMYNQLTENGFRVRLARITYLDSAKKMKPIERFGFLIEDENMMAKRNNFEIVERKLSHQDACDGYSINLFTVFQYMIGNTDWSIPNNHNIKIMANNSMLRPIPVPYDFDYSGVVNTRYAIPPEHLPIDDVRQRNFRGFCREDSVYAKIFELFNQRQEQIYNVIKEFKYLNDKEINAIIKYLDEFYKTINDPKKARAKITNACRKLSP